MVAPLSYPFLRYIESTRHLVFYRLSSAYPIPSMLRLPKVETLCLLDCSPQAVSSMLYSPFFPGLRRVHYLSPAPADRLLYQRFPSLDWVFPYRERPYPFYDAMVEAGKGRMEQGLLHQYVARWAVRGGEGLWFDVYVPGRGLVSGKVYTEQQRSYFHKKHCDGFHVPFPVVPTGAGAGTVFPLPGKKPHGVADPRWASALEHHTTVHSLERVYDQMVLNLPDATPFRSSGM